MAVWRKRTEVIVIFRYFTGIAMVYFAALSLFTAWQTGEIINLSQIQSYVNLVINAILFGYLSWSWLENKIPRYYLPLALVAATILPLFTNLIYLADPLESAQITITRSWFLFPILIVPLVLIAWQYRFRIVLAFIFLTTVIEVSTLAPRVKFINYETLPILGLPLIRAFALGTVGHVVTRLIATQRDQQRKLVDANFKLSEHAMMLEQLTVSRERNRLARDLHDTLAHTLSGLTVNLEAIKILLGSDHPQIKTRLDHALEKTRTGLRDTRRALKDLRVKQVEDLGLKLALENLALQAAARGQFEIQTSIPDVLPETSIAVEQIFYRIAQEALENIVKHAQASQVSLHLKVEEHQYSLIIQDDGIGFESSEELSLDTLGIKGMKERAAECCGELLVTSQPGRGTSISIKAEL
jgi:signal transduction histidine kinase